MSQLLVLLEKFLSGDLADLSVLDNFGGFEIAVQFRVIQKEKPENQMGEM